LGLSFLDLPIVDPSHQSPAVEAIDAWQVHESPVDKQVELAPQSEKQSEVILEPIDLPLSPTDQRPDLKLSLETMGLDGSVTDGLDEPVLSEAVASSEPLLAVSQEPEIDSMPTSLFSFSAEESFEETIDLSDADASEACSQTADVVEEALGELDSPFSMGDLLSSFETRQEEMTEQILPAVIENDQLRVKSALSDDAVHLADDSSLWPSVAKQSATEQSELDQNA
jgi:hypothetical protein